MNELTTSNIGYRQWRITANGISFLLIFHKSKIPFRKKEAQPRHDPESEGGFEDTGGGVDTGVCGVESRVKRNFYFSLRQLVYLPL